MRRVWKASLVLARVPVVLLLAVVGLLCGSMHAPTRPTFRFLGDNEPNRRSKMDAGDSKVTEHLYSFPAKFKTLSQVAQGELTALRYVKSPAGAAPAWHPEFTRSDRRTHITVSLQEARLLPDESDQDVRLLRC